MRLAAFAVAATIECDHVVMLGQPIKYAGLDPSSLDVVREAVDQYDGFATASLDVTNANTVGIEVLIRGSGESLSSHGYGIRQTKFVASSMLPEP
jgi:hypothetical protein